MCFEFRVGVFLLLLLVLVTGVKQSKLRLKFDNKNLRKPNLFYFLCTPPSVCNDVRALIND